jgi:large subunit ribosomal protein L21
MPGLGWRGGGEKGRVALDPRGSASIVRRFRGWACRGRRVAALSPNSFKGLTDMFAVIRTGGKQYRVAKDDVLSIEKLDGEVGATLTFGEVLMLGGDKPKSGAPLVKGASVTGEILAQGKGEKVIAFKKKRRKNTHRKRGHRQPFTKVKITDIHAG